MVPFGCILSHRGLPQPGSVLLVEYRSGRSMERMQRGVLLLRHIWFTPGGRFWDGWAMPFLLYLPQPVLVRQGFFDAEQSDTHQLGSCDFLIWQTMGALSGRPDSARSSDRSRRWRSSTPPTAVCHRLPTFHVRSVDGCRGTPINKAPRLAPLSTSLPRSHRQHLRQKRGD
jgi:hypothetical protein